MPYTTLVAGTSITASWANANIRDQTITPFATTAARASAITSPIEGMVTAVTDDDHLAVYNGSAWMVAADYGAWNTWVPVLNQSGVVAHTVTRAKYTQTGRRVTGSCHLGVTGSGGAGVVVHVSLPVTASELAGGVPIGAGYLYDASANLNFAGAVFLVSTTTAAIMLGNGGVTAGLGGDGFTAALAAGDAVLMAFDYEAA